MTAFVVLGSESEVLQQRIRPSGDNKLYLSPQQRKLLRRFAKKKTDEQIAKELGCSADLIAAQRQWIVEKLEIKSQEQFVEAAHQFANLSWKKQVRTK